MTAQKVKRKLTAILSADVEGYSRLMGEDEAATIRTLTVYKKAMTSLITQHHGRVVDSPGDNLLAEFASVVDAINCAVEIQRELAERNLKLPSERRMQFRMGVNLSDVVEEEGRIYGDGVNIAARLESICDGGGVCISGAAFEQVDNKLELEFQDLGKHKVKNITKPVRVYKVLMASDSNHSDMAETLELPDKPSIAVLPFVNMSEDPQQEYFSDGITEEIITGLSKISHLFVIANNSSFSYKGKQIKIQQVGRELGVKYVLEGSVRMVAERVRITAQLIDATTGHHIWAERFDRALQDIFALQDDITMKILIAMQLKLTEGEQARLYGRSTNNLEAYLKHLQGHQYARHFNKESNNIAQQLFEEAIAALKKAIRLNPIPPSWYLSALGWVYGITELHLEAIAAFKKSLEHSPDNLSAWQGLTAIYSLSGQETEALSAAENVLRIEPRFSLEYFAEMLPYKNKTDTELVIDALRSAGLK